MTMQDIVDRINCKHCTSSSSWLIYPYELNCWLVCKLTGQATDEKTCSKCKKRQSRKDEKKK